ncbi:MAG: alpha/beta hydrolase [Bdellovibrionota bacterium]
MEEKISFQETHFSLEHNHFNLFLEKIERKDTAKSTLKVPDILLVHGLTFSSHQFDVNYQDYSLARFLTKSGARVWLLDITGYGRSTKPKDGFIVNGKYASEDVLAAINFIRQKEKVDKINVLGWSFGTISCSLAAAKHPNWINSLILYAPIHHGLGLPPPQTDYQKFSPLSTEDDFQKLPGKNTINPAITDTNLFNLYRKQCQMYDGAGSPNGCRKDLFQSKSVELFKPSLLLIPTLVIAGDQDSYVNWEKDIPPIMKLLPNPKSKAVEIRGGSHVVMLEKPYHNQFQLEVWNFLMQTQP